MSTTTALLFPPLIYFEEYRGDFQTYFNIVYSVFENDFVKSQPYFMGVKVTAQKFPLEEGIHRTFYHITHQGDDEKNREPDFRRMERIRFPKFCVIKCPHENLLFWKNQRGIDTRILIFNEEEGYLNVLTERKGFNLFWTAYYIEHKHQRKKYIKEYEAYIKAKTA